MSDPFIGEIRMFAGDFAPREWAFCDGQLMSIAQNNALYSLFSTYYGGDGRSTFGLPDMRGRLPMAWGSGPGLTPRPLGARFGQEQVGLTAGQMPGHSHSLMANSMPATPTEQPQGAVVAAGEQMYTDVETSPVSMSPQALAQTGNSEAHDNMMPYLCVRFIVSLTGIYPSRS